MKGLPFRIKKIKKKSRNGAFLSFYDVAWFLATTPRYLFDSYKSETQSNARTNHVQEFPWDIALSFFPFFFFCTAGVNGIIVDIGNKLLSSGRAIISADKSSFWGWAKIK